MQLAPVRQPLPLVAILALVALASSLAAAPAWAHLGGAIGGGWRDGFAHPFSGLDHVAAMVAVGLWATQLPRPALWLLAPVFPLSMAVGVSMVPAGWLLPGAEDGAAISVAVLGVLLAVAARPPLAVGAAVVALFGLVHGYAHGMEMPETATPVLYGAGLITATVLLQLAGIGTGLLARSAIGQRVLPIGAAAIAGIGITLVLAL
jgi:urease accessory protein